MPEGIEKIIESIKKYSSQGENLIREAYDFAVKAHAGQYRYSGESYIVHPFAVAEILAELQLDVVTIAAGLLHDVVEDTGCEVEDIVKKFGPEIALLVDGVTKLSRIEYKTKEEEQVENLRKMFVAMARDLRVILIKLADRLHNMRTLDHQPPEKQKEVAKETIEIFAPLAHRLGIFRLKWELEDLSLRFLDPEKYYELVNRISKKRKEREEYIKQVTEILNKKLEEVNIEANIEGRPKHFYSIYYKMVNKGKNLEEIYDLVAVRVIVDNVKDCYGALGVIHALWKPIPGRFKDYIAMPKPNMYQSLHTTVIGPQGEPVEVQIRTWEMHRTAEYGIAAHWRYKEKSESDKDFEEKLSWLRQLLDWQRELPDAREFMESLKIDLFSDRVYVFTPRGDVVELPSGSVPIDFAYRVHTDVGHQCVGAKVNGRIVPLDYRLNTGDIVEILTSKGSGPSRDWLNLVETSQARNRIRQWFKKQKREENIAKGWDLLEKEIRRKGYDPEEIMKPEYIVEAGKRFNLHDEDDVYAAIGSGNIRPLQILSKIKSGFPEAETEIEETSTPSIQPWSGYGKPSKGVRIKGVENAMVHLARCCNPLPGDEIVGYITRGRGVSVHHKDCPNITHHKRTEKERLIEVAWDTEDDAIFQVHLEIDALDRPRLAADIMTAIADAKTIINSIHARAKKNNLATIDLKIEIRNLEHLNYIIQKVKKIKAVQNVKRVAPQMRSSKAGG